MEKKYKEIAELVKQYREAIKLAASQQHNVIRKVGCDLPFKILSALTDEEKTLLIKLTHFTIPFEHRATMVLSDAQVAEFETGHRLVEMGLCHDVHIPTIQEVPGNIDPFSEYSPPLTPKRLYKGAYFVLSKAGITLLRSLDLHQMWFVFDEINKLKNVQNVDLLDSMIEPVGLAFPAFLHENYETILNVSVGNLVAFTGNVCNILTFHCLGLVDIKQNVLNQNNLTPEGRVVFGSDGSVLCCEFVDYTTIGKALLKFLHTYANNNY